MRKSLLLLLLLCLHLCAAAAPVKSELPSWFKTALADPETFVGVSPPADNAKTGYEAALSSALMQWIVNRGGYKARATLDYFVPDDYPDSYSLNYADAGSYEGSFSVVVTDSYRNRTGEQFLACKILEKGAAYGRITFSRIYTNDQGYEGSVEFLCDVRDSSASANMRKPYNVKTEYSDKNFPSGYAKDIFSILFKMPLDAPELKAMINSGSVDNHSGLECVAELSGVARPVLLRLKGAAAGGVDFGVDQSHLMTIIESTYAKSSSDERYNLASSVSGENSLFSIHDFASALMSYPVSGSLRGVVAQSESSPDSSDFAFEKRFETKDFRVLWHVGDGKTKLPEELVPRGFNYSAGVSLLANLDTSAERINALKAAAAASAKDDYRAKLTEFLGSSETPSPAPSAASAVPEKKTAPKPEYIDVDRNIPTTGKLAANTFAVIIANENYDDVAPIRSAGNDGKVFKQYLTTTLGLPEKNIYYYPDATLGRMSQALIKIQKAAKVYGDIDIIFYYAGHGIPDPTGGEAYLLPVDAMPGYPDAAVAISRLYETLGSAGARSVTVFLDACFSGATRGSDDMIVAARGVRIKPKELAPQGNMVVFSASSGDEAAYSLDNPAHGVFTYHLLEKLRETKGSATLGELADHLTRSVPRTTFEQLDKVQTPTVSAGQASGTTWRNRRLAE